MTKLLGSWDPLILGMLERLGVELCLGVMGLAAELALKVCSGRRPRQTRRNLCHWSGRVPVCLGSSGLSYSWCWDRCVLLTSDTMILGMLERLGVEFPLGDVVEADVVCPKILFLPYPLKSVSTPLPHGRMFSLNGWSIDSSS